MMAGMAWLPSWLRGVGTAAFVAVLLVHLGHMVGAPGWGRGWHTCHVLMALGMVDMFLRIPTMVVPAVIGEIVFAVAALIVGGFVASEVARRGRAGWLWPIIGVDLAAMVYMFAMPSLRLEWLTVLLVAWFVVQAFGWVSGRLGALTVRDGLTAPAIAPESVPPESATATSAAPDGPAIRTSARQRTTAATALLEPAHDWSLRASLIVMNLGMAYMFLAMQFGMTQMGGGMPGMPGMGGM